MTESQFDSKFPASKVFKNSCEKEDKRKYYLLKNGDTNKGFVIDIGCTRQLSKITLKNTRNAHLANRFVLSLYLCLATYDNFSFFFIFRGTEYFIIELSEDNIHWVPVIYNQLQDARLLSCKNSPLEVFHFDLKFARFIRFRALSFYGLGAGLQYLNWE